MCGIVGAFNLTASGMDRFDAGALVQLAIADTVRGKDGTGLMFYDESAKKGATLYYVKEPATACSFIASQGGLEGYIEKSRFSVIHNRAATLGKLTEEHTHPFNFGTVSGVHNGTVSSWKTLLSEHIEAAEMDSQAIMEALSKIDPDPDAVGELLGSLEIGAYSLVWWDSRVDALRFARNDDRPMFMVSTRDNLWFGSELRMLEWILDKNRVSMHHSWATKIHHIIDIPVTGAEIAVHDFSKSVKLTSGGNNWWSRNWSSWDDYDDSDYYRWNTVSNSRYEGSTGDPRHVDIRGYASKMPALRTADTVTLTRMHNTMSAMVSADTARMPDLTGVRKAWEKYLLGHMEGANFTNAGTLRGTMHVCDVDADNLMYGYVWVDGAKVPISCSAATSDRETINAVLDILTGEGNREAIVPNVPIQGIRLYHNGMAAYIAGLPQCSAHEIAASEYDMETADILFAETHPDRASAKGDRVNWNIGWGI